MLIPANDLLDALVLSGEGLQSFPRLLISSCLAFVDGVSFKRLTWSRRPPVGWAASATACSA